VVGMKLAYGFAPLLNFDIDVADFRLTQGITIRLPNIEEKRIIEQSSDYYATKRWGKWKFVVCGNDVLIPSIKWSHQETYKDPITLSRALGVFKHGCFLLGPQYSVDKATMKCIGHGGFNINGTYESAEDLYTLSSTELVDFQRFFDKFSTFDIMKHRRIFTAIFRLGVSNEEGLMHQPIDLMIAFEALYLEQEQELAFKLATRVAYLIGDTTEKRAFIFQVMKAAYNLRSNEVHGGDLPEKIKITREKSLELSDFVIEVENILRESIKKFIDLMTKYTHKQLTEKLLDENIPSGGTLLSLTTGLNLKNGA
jgi:hypothetical protein